MGVTKLWQLLGDCGEGSIKPLSECSGETWAVDLSAWMVQGCAAGIKAKGVSPTYAMMKTVFYRTLCLLRNGIRPVIVMDGEMAPEIKSQIMQNRTERAARSPKEISNNRTGFQFSNKLCERLLEALGLKVISSSGEAEKTCALLNSQGIVDACLSDDIDTFLYGAKKVYRNFDMKNQQVELHTLDGIKAKIELDQRDMVVMALLSGCDYSEGIRSIGPKTAMDLVHCIHKYCSDVLARICSWRDSPEILSLEEQRQRFATCPKLSHCSKCQHPGNKQQHETLGCNLCGSTKECITDGSVPCSCEYHMLQQHTAPYKLEMEVRSKAVSQEGFPDLRIVDEFLGGAETFNFTSVEPTLPDWDSLADALQLDGYEVMEKMIPVLIHMHLHGLFPQHEFSPIRIVRDCKRKFKPCYLVLWKRLAFDKWTPQPTFDPEKTPPHERYEEIEGNPYIIALPRELFARKYQNLIDKHIQRTSSRKGKKRRLNQKYLAAAFKARRKLFEETMKKIQEDAKST